MQMVCTKTSEDFGNCWLMIFDMLISKKKFGIVNVWLMHDMMVDGISLLLSVAISLALSLYLCLLISEVLQSTYK